MITTPEQMREAAIDPLKWKRNATLDTYTADTAFGTYTCVRTWVDVAKLWFNGECLRANASDGSHRNNMAFAETHYIEMVKQNDRQ